MLNHVPCGWSGERSELVPEYWHGHLCSMACPQCGGDWPFLFDEFDGYFVDDGGDAGDYSPTNRQRSQQASKRLFWCDCDMALVGQHGRCGVCRRVMCRHKSKNTRS